LRFGIFADRRYLNIGQATAGKCFARWNSSSVSSRGAAADRFADPEKPATNDLFAAEQQFAPVEKSQSIVKAARGSTIHTFVYICDLSSGESLGLI
jgi:hypothetical protein